MSCSGEKYVDWYGYSASVSPYILEQFEREAGYKFRPEFIIDQGYYNNQYRVPSKEFKDFQAFQRREVAKLAREMVDITHELGKEAMMFLGDHWIGTEPFMEEFKSIGLDAVVGSVGNGSTLRLISDIPGVKYTEGRFLPYFFPDTFHEGGDPVREAKENWVTARRAILRKPIDRIGYGGYLKLACAFPEFIDYVESVCNEFRELYDNIKGTTPYCVKTVAVLNCWGKMRAWGCHMVHHALYQKQNYSYAGVIEALSGAPFDVRFISFDDLHATPMCWTAWTCSSMWATATRPTPAAANGRTRLWRLLCAASCTMAAASSAWANHRATSTRDIICSWPAYWAWRRKRASRWATTNTTGTSIPATSFWRTARSRWISAREKRASTRCRTRRSWCSGKKEVQMAVHAFGKGRAVYISGLPYSFEKQPRFVPQHLRSAHDEESLHKWFSSNFNVEVHAYVKNGKYCVVNNTYEPQSTVVYKGRRLQLCAGYGGQRDQMV